MRSKPKPPFEIPREGALPVTKIDAAIRQLETAVTLWFFDGDPVSICTLAYAGYEIVDGLNNGFGGPPTMLRGRGIKDEYRKDVIGLMRSTPNFFKHAGKDPYETHFFAASGMHAVLLDAVNTYGAWKLERRPIFETFRAWFWFTDPKSRTKPPEQVGGKVVDVDFIKRMGKQQFFNDFLPLFTRQIAGAK